MIIMVVKAYLIKTIKTRTEDDELIIEKILEKTPTFNLRTNEKILKLFLDNGFDNTNDDLNGELFMDKETWQEILNSLIPENYSPNDLKIIRKITKDLKDEEIIFYECF